jgi:hypothetical protein
MNNKVLNKSELIGLVIWFVQLGQSFFLERFTRVMTMNVAIMNVKQGSV